MGRAGIDVARQHRVVAALHVCAVLVGLIGLPVAVWLDLRQASENVLRTQASEISRVIDDMRAFYGSDVVGRVLQANGATDWNVGDVRGVREVIAHTVGERPRPC
jgi:hypothetical protein